MSRPLQSRTCMILRVSDYLNFVPQMPLLCYLNPTTIIALLLSFPSSSSMCILVSHQGSDLQYFSGSLLYLNVENREF